jgi:hypothetical protein
MKSRSPNTALFNTATIRVSRIRRHARALMVLLFAAGGLSFSALGQSDDFNSGNDSIWKHFNALAIVGVTPVFSFPNDGTGGKAYRIESPAPPIADAGPARTFSHRTNVYSDFYAAVDLIGFDGSLNQAFGFLFRAENIGLGTTTGYVMNYDPQQASGGRGQIQINRVTGEQPATIGAANVTLDPTRRYRFVLTAVGSAFTAQVYDLADLTTPLAMYTATDATYPSGVVGVFNFSRVNSATIPDKALGRADTTFDNYYVAPLPPASVASPGTPHSLPEFPQVVNRSPASRSSFYAATNGVRFTATTLSTNRINPSAIKLLLNGEDVSSNLAITGSSSNLTVAYNGLSANKVYDGRIVLADTAGRATTNEWTFDTFSEAFLNSAAVKIIEAEDYNYDSGKFQDNPPLSGLNSAGAQVSGSGAGYFDLTGTPDVDYSDKSAQPGGGITADYRTTDFVGTQAGSAETTSAELGLVVSNDTVRQKYSTLGLPEYQVRRTEGGEWLNYTRTFAPGDYNVYLRVAGRSPQAVNLDRVTGDRTQPNQTTTPLGVFNVPNLGLTINYRYVPLTDAAGKPVVVNLSGLQTLRLTMGGPTQNVTQYTMVLNYLAFIPAASVTLPLIQLESALTVAGPYAVDSAAVIIGNNATGNTITTAVSGSARFYRVRSTATKVRIASIQVVNGTLTLKYDIVSP